jgi:hypothetical protein
VLLDIPTMPSSNKNTARIGGTKAKPPVVENVAGCRVGADRSGPVGRYKSMYKVLSVLLIVVFSAASAAAHHHKHRYHGFLPYSYVLRHNDAIVRPEPYRPEGSRSEVTPPPASSHDSTGGVIPPDWKKQSSLGSPTLNGGRFVSPDGSASFDFYTTVAHDQPITEHMKSFAFGNGDEITSLAGERTWIAASGFKNDRLFFRKAALACGGDRWHHIAFEYPANAKRSMQDFVRRAVEMLDSSQNEGCDTPLSKSADDGDARSAEPSSPVQ